MADLQPIQNSFESGELAPILHGRTNSQRYQTGLRQCDNFIPLSHGPVLKRGGWGYIANLQEPDTNDLRLFDFEISPTLGFVVTVGDTYVEVFDEEGPVLAGLAGLELLFNYSFEQGLTGWSTASSPQADVTWDEERRAAVLTTDQSQRDCQLGQAVTTTNPGNPHTIRIEGGPVGATDSIITVQIGTSFGDDSIDTFVGPGNTFEVTPGVSPFWVTVDVRDGVGSWAVDEMSVKESPGASVPVRFASPWIGLQRFIMDREVDPTDDRLFLFHPNVQPYQLTVDITANVWSLDPVVFTSPPAQWTGVNWPRTGAFFQGRFWLAGTPQQPNTMWGSKSGDFLNFDQGTALDDEAIEFTITRRGSIVWMSGAKSLVVGTESRELIITGDADGVVTPSSVDIEQQSAYGSLEAHIEEIGEKVLYVSSSGRRLRSMGYEWQRDAWVSVDLAWPSIHLTGGRISEIAFMRDPQQVLWVSLYDGTLITCAYDRELNIVGWNRNTMPGVKVQRVAADADAGTGRAWMLCTFNGQNIITEYNPALLTDLHATKTDVAGFTIFDGLDHLEGAEVDVTTLCASGLNQVYEGRHTVLNGAVTLSRTVFVAAAGLPVRSIMETLPLEGGVRVGSAQGLKKRWSRIWTRLVQSVMPLINGQRPPEREPASVMDEPQPPVTTDVEVRNLGWTTDGTILVEQDLPLPTVVSAVFGEEQTNKLAP